MRLLACFFIASYVLCISALHNGNTHIEAGAGAIRLALRKACSFNKGLFPYRGCLVQASTNNAQVTVLLNELDTRCKSDGACTPSKTDVDKVKMCLKVVKDVNPSLPSQKWHGYLYEDIVVGCLSKESVTQVVDFGPTRIENGNPVFDIPYSETNLKNLLKDAVPDRVDLQSRVVFMCNNYKPGTSRFV